MVIKTFLFLSLLSGPLTIAAQDGGVDIPADVNAFVAKDAVAIASETADLNGDGTIDHILVLERAGAAPGDGSDHRRTLLVLTRNKNGGLKLAARNDKVVYCRSCGGMFGDPFAGISVRRNSFTVDNYGGSNWRWSDSYEFKYSRRDRTWQLVLITKDSFQATDPDKHKTKVITPKTYGKIDLANFDPDRIRN